MKQLAPPDLLTELIRQAKSPLALVLHQSADPDAVGSAAALAALIQRRTGSTCSIYAESLNRSAKQIADTFDLSVAPPEELVNHPIIVLVDLNNLEQIGTLIDYLPQDNRQIFCIDHHVFHPELAQFTDFILHDDELRSTAELILQLWIASGESMDARVATLLACGIVYDSRHFHIAVDTTFEHFMTLLKYGADYQRVLDLLSTTLDKSERIARLKAAGRAIVYDEFNLLISATVIRSYEASVCRALINLGADIAIACAVKKDEVRLSARCIPAVHSALGLDLASDVMEPLGSLIGGAGGGHPTAAGANGTATSDHALGLALELLRKTLKMRTAQSPPVNSQASRG